MKFRRNTSDERGSIELCRAVVRVPPGSKQELGHNEDRPRRRNEPTPAHALVCLLDNGRSMDDGRYCLITVGGPRDPFPTFPVYENVTTAYRVFLMVQAVIAAGGMDVEGRVNADVAVTHPDLARTTQWATRLIGAARLQRIRNFPVAEMPTKVQATIERRRRGRR